MAAPIHGGTIGAEQTLDRVANLRRDAAWLSAALADPTARFVLLRALDPGVRPPGNGHQGHIAWLSRAEVLALGWPIADALFLGVDADDRPHFAIDSDRALAAGLRQPSETAIAFRNLRTLAVEGFTSPEELSILATARGLAAWAEVTRCCNRCGGTLYAQEGGWRRRCWACEQDHYPRADPVAIMLVSHGDHALLVHEPRFPPKFYSCAAGYIEPGEPLEAAAAREVLEETGVAVGRVRYVASQPWPFPHSLMIGCVAEALPAPGGGLPHITIDAVELTDARWFSREDLTLMLNGQHPDGLTVPGAYAIAHQLMRAWLAGAA